MARHSLRRLLVLSGILFFYVFQVERAHTESLFGQFHDDSIYFTTAKALAQGHGYTLLSFPGAPSETKYPIVYPWLLSFVWRIDASFPANVKLAIRLSELFGCWSLIAAFFLFRKLPNLGEAEALWLTAIFSVQPVFLRMSGFVMSDVLFLALLLTALALCLSDESSKNISRALLLTGAIAGFSVGVRTFGATLVAGIFCTLLLQKRFRSALVFCGAAAVAVALFTLPTLGHSAPHVTAAQLSASREPGWEQVLAYYTSYTQFQWGMGVPSFSALLQLVRINFLTLAISPGPILLGTFGDASFHHAGLYAGILLSFVLWIGLLRQWRSPAWRPALLTMLFYFCVVLVWPYPQPERFLLPFIPVFLAALWCEGQRAVIGISAMFPAGRAARRALAAATLTISFSLAAIAAWNLVVRDTRSRLVGAAAAATLLHEREEAYRWLSAHSEAGDRVAAWKDAVLYLYTGRQGLRPVATLPQDAYASDAESERRDLAHLCDAPRHARVRYWLITREDFNLEPNRERLAARQAELGASMPVVFRSSGGAVEIHDASCLTQSGAAPPCAEGCEP